MKVATWGMSLIAVLALSACGTAASVATLAAPSANLCSANHTAGVVSSGANTFDWACQDQVSSATASCSAPRRYTIATTVTPPGLVIGPRVFGAGGSVSCVGASVVMAGASGTYLGGNTVTCTAAANPGFAFGAFSGDCSGGSCTLANAAGDKALTASFLKSQSIRFDTPQFVSVQTNAGPLTLRPYAIATSDLRQTGLPVTLVSTTTNVCTVSGAGPTYTVNLIAAGACLLTAAQAGDATYAPASLDVNFLVTPASTYSYTDHNDGTVTDADNGLMWDQCSMGQTTTATTANSPPACNGAASGLTWSQAFDSAVSANAARYKGYGDWRLPTVGELSTLVKGKACPTIDATYFPGTACDYPYRSSTNYAPDSANAWSVDFNEGSSNIPTKVNYTHHVRLVRGETFFDPFASGAEAPAITPADPTTAMLSLTATANATALGGTQSTGTTAYYIVVAPGANGHLTLDSAHVRAVVADCDVLLLQLEIPPATALAAARLAKNSGATVVLNASPAGTDAGALAELAAVTDVVIVNETEAAQWHWPVPDLVITRGADGAVHRTAGGETHVPAPDVEAIDTTGAGDVFAGVLAAGWRADPHHALRRAVTAGALATLVPGAGNCAPRYEVIEDALEGGVGN